MSLGAREIEALVRELQPLVGARVDAVRLHAERALTLELHGPSGATLLLLSAEPDVTRLHVASRRPPQPEHPFGAQAVLRKALEGARLTALTVLPGDRVVALDLAKGEGPLRLVAELTGRHGNLFLLDAGGVIRASAGHNLSQRRQLVAGQPYVPPAPPPAAATDAAERQERDARAGAAAGAAVPGPFPLSAAVERRYAEREAARLLAEARRRLREPLRAGLARARRALERLAEEEARVPAAEADRRAADLLKQNLRLLKRGQREVTLTEWTDAGGREVTVTLDPALSPQQNMERHYRRYRRIVESAGRVAARAAEMRGREVALRALLDAVDAAPLAALPRLERDARALSAGPKPQPVAGKRRRVEPALPYRTFRSLAGVAILVGRGAAENDALTLRVARGNDAWLHARGLAGAHVVIRVAKGQSPDQETLLDAAHLAVHFSDARGAPACDVAWTRARFVRKAKGSPPGAVTYSQERVIALRVEPRRVERLLAEEEAPSP
jgi:predicted ribosome quality control (RQC) complex YloA/Tae2 family protein